MQVWNVLLAARCKYGTQKKITIWAPSHNFVGLYLRNYGTYRQSEKNLLSSNISSTCPHNMVNFGPLAAEIVSLVWGTPANFNVFRVLPALLHGTLVVGVSQTAAFNRGRHLYSAGRPSRWEFAHISSLCKFCAFLVCIFVLDGHAASRTYCASGNLLNRCVYVRVCMQLFFGISQLSGNQTHTKS